LPRWRAPCALAQGSPASPSDSSRQFDAGRGAELDNWQWRAQRGAEQSEPEKAVQGVLEAVTQRDCAAAATRLNAGLAKAYPEVVVLAGAMYEDGICLKPNWQRAVSLYERAVAAKHPGAAARLAAGYASAAGGHDLAASLWWALQARTAMPGACVQVAPLVGDPDKFVAALKAWPAGQLGHCVYMGAVMATVQAEIEAPGLAAAYGLEGKVRLSFVPEASRIDVSEDLSPAAVPTGVMSDATARERDLRAARTALSTYLRQLADRAVKRYDKPAGLPAGWRADAEHVIQVAR
jgi:TPR repeat protein